MEIEARGVLREPRQCSIACLEPCLYWGIRTNGERAVTAAVSSRSIPRRRWALSHSLFNPALPEAGLSADTLHPLCEPLTPMANSERQILNLAGLESTRRELRAQSLVLAIPLYEN